MLETEMVLIMVIDDTTAVTAVIDYLREINALSPTIEAAIRSNDPENIRAVIKTEPLVASCQHILKCHSNYLEARENITSLAKASDDLQTSMTELVATAQRFEDLAKELADAAIKLQQTYNVATMEFMVDL